LRKEKCKDNFSISYKLNDFEKETCSLLYQFPTVINESAKNYDPSSIANYVYAVAKQYNSFYHECPVLKADNDESKNIRLAISSLTAHVIKTSLNILGINAPERM
jgi:arginyl-tRNA synthetase